MKEKIQNIFCMVFTALILSGCNGGGGGGGVGLLSWLGLGGVASEGAGSIIGAGGGAVGGGVIGGASSVAIVNPEPSSLILLGTGLLGMAVYTKARFKSKRRK